MRPGKPNKKTDLELWAILAKKISDGNYIFAKHAKQRLKDRDITDIEVLDILENKKNRKRKRNKRKDEYEPGRQDWKYCIEGHDIDGLKIRIIISFNEELMVIITVIRVGGNNYE